MHTTSDQNVTTEQQAALQQEKAVRLNLPAEAAANRLYDHVGLKVYRTEPLPDGTGMVLYRQAELASLYTQAGLDSERQLGTEE